MNLRIPKYRKHISGQARVTLNNKDYLLGPYGSAESKAKYARLLAEWQASGSSFGVPVESYSISQLIADYLIYAKKYYGKNAKVEITKLRPALRTWKRLYGPTPVVEFKPLHFRTVRDELAKENDRCRAYVNRLAQRITQVLRWAVSEDKIPTEIPDAIAKVPGLQRNKTELREAERVKPVSDTMVEATLPHLSPVVRAMVKLQRACGARPGEIVSITPSMVKQSGEVWEIHFTEHKTAWRDKSRIVYLSDEAYAILKPYLDRPADQFCFSPKESLRMKRQKLTEQRVTPLSCGNRPGSNRKRKPKWGPNDNYTANTYRQAIQRGCKKAFPLPKGTKSKAAIKAWWDEYLWNPNQLRHSFATQVRREVGIEEARVLLGHSNIETTEIYAEQDKSKAIEALRRLSK